MVKTEEDHRLQDFLRRMEIEYRLFLRNELDYDLEVNDTYECYLTFPRLGGRITRTIQYQKERWEYQEAFPEQSLIDIWEKKNRSLQSKDKFIQLHFRFSVNAEGNFYEDHFSTVLLQI